MKKYQRLIYFILIVSVFFVINNKWIFRNDANNKTTENSTKNLVETTIGDAPSSEDDLQVSKVVDGDTIKVFLNGKIQSVRLIWIDTPESNTTRYGYIECYWDEAGYFLTTLLWNQKVSLLYDETQWKYDVYNRLLAYVILSGQNINKMMIEYWYAWEYTYNEPYKFQTEFKSAEVQAQKDDIWLRSPKTCNWERKKKINQIKN